MTMFEAIVRAITPETEDAVTLHLEGPRVYQAGQFLTIDPFHLEATRPLAEELEQRKGKKERARAYSLGSAPHEPLLTITIKAESEGEFPPVLSRYLCNGVRVGDRLPCAGFAGLYTLPPDLPAGAHVVHICAGSGIVPNFGIIKDVLHRRLPIRQTLLYSNGSLAEAIYRDSLARLEAEHPDRLRIVHFLTRNPAGAPPTAVSGRVAAQHLLAQVPDVANNWYFVCGPSVTPFERAAARHQGVAPPVRFLESMRALLAEVGVPRHQVAAEGW